METTCLDLLARHLHQLFLTLFWRDPEGKQLQRLDFWQLSLMQELLRIRRFIDKNTGKANFSQKTIEGVVHLQPRLHAPVDSLPTLLVIVIFPVTHLKVVLPCLLPLQSTVVAPQTKQMSNECAWLVKHFSSWSLCQTAHESRLCRQWSNQMLFPGRALLTERDGLKTGVMVSR